MNNIRRGDQVIVISGNERGKIGKVIKVLHKEKRVLVEKINIVKKHRRYARRDEPTGIVEIESPINISNVAVVCPNCGERTKVGFRTEGERKVRYCRKCDQSVEVT